MVAQAQSQSVAPAAPSAPDAETAKRHFQSGLVLVGAGQNQEALAAFLASYRLGGRPAALRNAAQCERNLKHFAAAYESYDRLLTTLSSSGSRCVLRNEAYRQADRGGEARIGMNRAKTAHS